MRCIRHEKAQTVTVALRVDAGLRRGHPVQSRAGRECRARLPGEARPGPPRRSGRHARQACCYRRARVDGRGQRADRTPHRGDPTGTGTSRRPLVEAGRLLPDLPPVLRRHRRRRGRGPGRDPGPSGRSGLARGRCPVDLAVLPVAHGRLRVRRQRLLRRRPHLRHPRRLRRAGRGRPLARAQGDHRLGPQPHLGPAPLVRRRRVGTRQRPPQLVRLA